jgi:hypothetical protein
MTPCLNAARKHVRGEVHEALCSSSRYALRNFQHNSNEISNRWIAESRTIGSLGRARTSSSRATAFSKSTRNYWAFVTVGSAVLRLAKFLRHPREIDNVDRIEGRCLLELVVDRRENGARNGGWAFYSDIDIGALAGRAGRARTKQENTISRIGHMPPYHGSGEFGGAHWVPDYLHAVILPPRPKQGDRRGERSYNGHSPKSCATMIRYPSGSCTKISRWPAFRSPTPRQTSRGPA